MRTSDEIDQIATAMYLCQGMMAPAVKDSQAHKYKYSDLASVWEVIRTPLFENGLSVWQDVHDNGDSVSVTTRIVHKSGQWVEHGPLTVPTGKRDAHSTGSSCTYGRRYGLCAALCVITEDDDGQAAQKTPPAPKKELKAVNHDEWMRWAKQLFKDCPDQIDEYIDELCISTGKTDREIVQILGQDDQVFSAKFKLWWSNKQ